MPDAGDRVDAATLAAQLQAAFEAEQAAPSTRPHGDARPNGPGLGSSRGSGEETVAPATATRREAPDRGGPARLSTGAELRRLLEAISERLDRTEEMDARLRTVEAHTDEVHEHLAALRGEVSALEQRLSELTSAVEALARQRPADPAARPRGLGRFLGSSH